MDNNRIKTINTKKPYYYQDMIYYIKNGNKDLKTINPTTKNIYKKIIQQGTKQHKICWGNFTEKTFANSGVNMEKHGKVHTYQMTYITD